MAELDPITQTFSSGDALEASPLRLFVPGTRLANRYEIRRAIDSGGSAVVYEAYDRELHRDIALKVLRPDRITDAALTRFRREVAIARDASSPRLVRTFDIQTSDGAIYLTMALIEGESLRRRLQDSPRLPIDETIRVASAIAEGLDALHSLNIIHRDVKPGNVLLDTNGEIKLGDFGLARHLEHDTAHATSTGAIVGTLAYLSPEQALGTGVDARSDLYGLGVVMFEMLTGKLPFEAESALGSLLARIKTSPDDVRRLRKDCPRWLAAIVARLLERKPENRYASARAVLADLQFHRAALLPRRLARLAFAGIALVVLAVATVYAFHRWDDRHAFSHLTVSNEGIVTAVSRSGDVLWSLRGIDPETTRQYAVLTHGHGGEKEIAAILRAKGDMDMDRMHTVSFLDPRTGTITRRVRLPDAASRFRYLPSRYFLRGMRAVDLDGDAREEIVATFVQYPEWPSYTVVYEPRLGRARVVYVATGHFHLVGAADIDGDHQKDLLMQGVSFGYGWYNALAAVKLHPAVSTLGEPVEPAETPDIGYPADHNLLWFTYLPRGTNGVDVTATVQGHRIRLQYPDRQVDWGIDGLPVEADNRHARSEAKLRAFAQLREADRLVAAGSYENAIAAGNAALREARTCGEPLLIESVQMRRGRYLVRASRIAEAEAHYDAISRNTVAAPDIAMEAAEELHLHGEVERAVTWYRRVFAAARANGDARSRHEVLEGLVFALDELGRRDEAIAEAERFLIVYRYTFSGWPKYYREFVRWRAGKRPDVENVQFPDMAIDVLRYWRLEFDYANGASPESLLLRFEADFEAQSPTRSALLSLHADVLHRLGRTAEARAMIDRALQLGLIDTPQTTIARAHLPLVRERHARIMRSL
jgi:tRNA A-37 threonylcarbamoyl transferase component Bud32/tetratricopeptide (TPR) repeat protein